MIETELSEMQLAAWRGFITSHARLVAEIDRKLTEADCLPLHWYDVIIELVEAADHRLRMHELADRVVLSRSGLTRLVDKLEKEGLLYREPDPADRRGAYAVLTERGHKALRSSWPVYAGGISEHFARHLKDDEVRSLVEIFNRLLDATQST